MSSVTVGPDGLARCPWGNSTSDYRDYHDTEWGRPVHGDDALFERLVLEGFQSGLSWITILRKRENFRAAFAGFSIAKVAAFGESDVDRLLADAGIVRNRAKIEATIANARAAADLPDGLSAFLWSYEPAPVAKRWPSLDAAPTTSAESTSLSKDLKKRGFRFVGPTTMYALMEAVGMVDGHLEGCCVAPYPRP